VILGLYNDNIFLLIDAKSRERKKRNPVENLASSWKQRLVKVIRGS